MHNTNKHTMAIGCSKSSYLVDCFRTLFPSKSCPTTDADVVLAVVVTAVMNEVGVAVTDPVPVPFMVLFRFTLLRVCVMTTEPPLLGVRVHGKGEMEDLEAVKVVIVVPVEHTASDFNSSDWLFSN